MEYYDNPTIRKIEASARSGNYKVNDFIIGVVKSDAFRLKAVPKGQGAGVAAGEGH